MSGDLVAFVLARAAEREAEARIRERAWSLWLVAISPEFVLRAVAAVRGIVEEHPLGEDGYCGDGLGLHGCKWRHPCPTLRHLASVDSDHPDYQEGWTP